ncbi:MAG: hypothetical protein JO362_12370 [Streptomycetaceae bacterium]|nr:hypothetical protein [Streptomycetaceae bacterium]
MTARTRPLGATAIWDQVMATAGWQCQCKGACGSRHSRSGLRCDGTTRLAIGPVDLALPAEVSASLPAEQLRAWCPKCHGAALRRHRADAEMRRRMESEPPPALFDINP